MTGLEPDNDRLLEIAVVVTGPSWNPALKAPCWPSTSRMNC